MANAAGVHWGENTWADDTWAVPSWEKAFATYDFYTNNDGVTYYQNDGVDWYITRSRRTSKTLTHSGDIVYLETVTDGVALCETTRGVEIGN